MSESVSTSIRDLITSIEGMQITREHDPRKEGPIHYTVVTQKQGNISYSEQIGIKYGISVISEPGDFDNDYNYRRRWLDCGDHLFFKGWIEIKRDTRIHRKREIHRAFCIVAPHHVQMKNSKDVLYKREGKGYVCYIIEDVSYIPKTFRAPAPNSKINDLIFNDTDSAKERLDLLLNQCTSGVTDVGEQERQAYLKTYTKLVKSYHNLKLDECVPVAGWYPYQSLIDSIDAYNNKKTSTVCTASVSLEFDYRAAMYNIGFCMAKCFSDDGFDFLEFFNKIPTICKVTKDYNTFSRGDFLATLSINEGIFGAINLRILAYSGVDYVYLHGVEVASVIENLSSNQVLQALNYLKGSIMYTANELSCEAEHMMAFAQGLHSAWHLHSHTDEGGWIRQVHSHVRYPRSHGYLKCDKEMVNTSYSMTTGWLRELGKKILDVYLCYAYCSTLADPCMTINGHILPVIALRRDYDGKSGIISYEQFKKAVHRNDTAGIEKRVSLSDFKQARMMFDYWAINLKNLFATCLKYNSGTSDIIPVFNPKVFLQIDHHFSTKTCIIPFSWIEPTGIAMYRHARCPIMPVCSIFDNGVLDFMQNIHNVGYTNMRRNSYGTMQPGDIMTLQLGKHSPRYCGAHYIMNYVYSPYNGLSSSYYNKRDAAGRYVSIKARSIFTSRDTKNCENMRWVLPHSTIPNPAECVVYQNDVLWTYEHNDARCEMPSIASFSDGLIKVTIVPEVPSLGYWDMGKAQQIHKYVNRALFNTIRENCDEAVLEGERKFKSGITWLRKNVSALPDRQSGRDIPVSQGKSATGTLSMPPTIRAVNYGQADQQREVKRAADITTQFEIERAQNLGREDMTAAFRPGDKVIIDEPTHEANRTRYNSSPEVMVSEINLDGLYDNNNVDVYSYAKQREEEDMKREMQSQKGIVNIEKVQNDSTAVVKQGEKHGGHETQLDTSKSDSTVELDLSRKRPIIQEGKRMYHVSPQIVAKEQSEEVKVPEKIRHEKAPPGSDEDWPVSVDDIATAHNGIMRFCMKGADGKTKVGNETLKMGLVSCQYLRNLLDSIASRDFDKFARDYRGSPLRDFKFMIENKYDVDGLDNIEMLTRLTHSTVCAQFNRIVKNMRYNLRRGDATAEQQ